jgi:hypothetical protein
MRESKMLLFKNMKNTKKRNNLGYLLEFQPSDYEKQPVILNRFKRTAKQPQKQPSSSFVLYHSEINCRYHNA